ncbi:unnamed protein product [Pseudo-nitzschia multistriata]|uniref:Uncharacterized protein n=1 Tax=Pseudo-nitzschia multistriata TaxID=183589 RepID=A0A448Z2V7_9STRA|nr:unnamed protein product [Pseudo-nitzschia multistriata]
MRSLSKPAKTNLSTDPGKMKSWGTPMISSGESTPKINIRNCHEHQSSPRRMPPFPSTRLIGHSHFEYDAYGSRIIHHLLIFLGSIVAVQDISEDLVIQSFCISIITVNIQAFAISSAIETKLRVRLISNRYPAMSWPGSHYRFLMLSIRRLRDPPPTAKKRPARPPKSSSHPRW